MKEEKHASSPACEDDQEPPMKRVKKEDVKKDSEVYVKVAKKEEQSEEPVESRPTTETPADATDNDAGPESQNATSSAPTSSAETASADDIATAAAALSAAMTSVPTSDSQANMNLTSTADAQVNLNLSSQLNAQLAQVAAAMANNTNSYQQFFANIDPNAAALAMAAAVSAGASSAGVNQTAAAPPPQLTTEMLKREMINQKVRADNRERKKRWREQNEERNKDNDLRCRVNKRAHKLFGKDDSEHKRRWIEDEFLKRQTKRKEKERRKQVVNGVIGAGGSADGHAVPGMDLAAQQDSLHSQHLHESNFLAKLLSNAGASDGSTNHLAKEFLQLFLPASTDLTSQALNPASSSTATASDTEKLAALLKSAAEAASSQTDKSTEGTTDTEQATSADTHTTAPHENGEQLSQFPLDAVMTLMQLNAGWKK